MSSSDSYRTTVQFLRAVTYVPLTTLQSYSPPRYRNLVLLRHNSALAGGGELRFNLCQTLAALLGAQSRILLSLTNPLLNFLLTTPPSFIFPILLSASFYCHILLLA